MNEIKKKARNILLFVAMMVCMLIVCIYFENDTVYAINYTFPNYITYNGRLYKVTKRGANVTDEMLLNMSGDNFQYKCMKFKQPSVNSSTVPNQPSTGVNNHTFDCEKGYDFRLSDTGKGGIFQDGTFTICPDADSRIKFDQIQKSEKIESIGNGKVRVSFDFDPNLLYIRKLIKTNYYDEQGVLRNDYRVDGGPNTYTVIYGNSFIINDGEDFYAEFYVRENSGSICSGSPVGYVRDFDTNYRTNPVLSYTYDDGRNICGTLKSTCSTSGDSCDAVTTGMVEYCFKQFVTRSESYPSRDTILQQIHQLEEYKKMSNINPSNNSESTTLTCNFIPGSDNRSTTTSTTGTPAVSNGSKFTVTKVLPSTTKNKYFQAVCTETMEVYYDDPKAVNAGAGFSYTTIIKITRSCTPKQIRNIVKQAGCIYEPSCWGFHHQGDKAAGPNDDFDNCVTKCDNGAYSQACINSCYKEVYGKEKAKGINYTDRVGSDLLSFNSNKTGMLFMRGMLGQFGTESNCTPGVTTLENGKVLSSCKVLVSNHGCNGDRAWCYLEHGTEVGFASTCNGSDVCYEVYQSDPNCVANPEKEYYEEIQSALAELKAIAAELGIEKNVANSYKSEFVETGVFDDYYNAHQTLPAHSEVTLELPTPVLLNTAMLGNTDQDDPTYPISSADRTYNIYQYTSVRTELVELTQAYVSKESKQDNVTGTIYKNDKLKCERDDRNNTLCLNYYDGGYKYYTSLLAPEVNRWMNAWPYYNANYHGDYSIQGYKKNIDVDLKNFGTWQQWNVDIDCMYGLYNDAIIDNPNGPNDCREGDICSKGVQYIYREIDLTDAFPNDRNPRWNWTGTITNQLLPSGSRVATGAALPDDRSRLLYNVDPDALTKYIESNGYDIYDVKKDSSEIDYEFVLTRKNLINIRRYNKQVRDFNEDGYNNYLDYDLSCYTKKLNGKDRVVCTSNFLDTEGDDGYITYSTAGFTAAARKQIAMCNNARNQDCYDVSSTS